jgi:PAS domain S-box-containing protein
VVLQSVLLVSATIVALGIVSFFLARALLSARVLSQVEMMARVREETIEEMLFTSRERTSLLALRMKLESLPAKQVMEDMLHAAQIEFESQDIPVKGMTVFRMHRAVLASVGENIPAQFAKSEATTLVPRFLPKEGWYANDVYVPLVSHGQRIGTLAVRYDIRSTVASLFSAESLGSDARMMLGFLQGQEIFVADHSRSLERLHSYPLGFLQYSHATSGPLARAALGGEGAARIVDEAGQDVFAAYRFIPSLGWGLVVQIPAYAALSGTLFLGISITAVGLLLLFIAAFFASVLSRTVTAPLARLSASMQALQPGHWQFNRSVHTGDEVEVLDAVTDDLTTRLRDTYNHLEEKVEERTEALHKQFALDRAILDTIEYGVVMVDTQGRITDINPAALHLLQWKRNDVVGHMGTDILVYMQHKMKITKENHPLQVVLQHHTNFRSHASKHPSLLRANQTILPVTLVITPLLQDDRLLGAVAVFQDMTEERQIDYLKTEFISLASHQLRTPLSSIRWYVEILSENKKNFTDDQISCFAEIDTASRRMAHLLEALLHVARLDGGGLIPEEKEVDLVEVLHQMMSEWEMLAKEKGIVFSVAFPFQSLTIHTDPVLLQVVIQNFLANALKYSTSGNGIRLGIRENTNEAVSIFVQDSGVGIPMSEQKRVFEKFFRAHNVRQMDTDGTGLGLYMSKSIAEKLGGTITFESEEGKGSTFIFTLPLKK